MANNCDANGFAEVVTCPTCKVDMDGEDCECTDAESLFADLKQERAKRKLLQTMLYQANDRAEKAEKALAVTRGCLADFQAQVTS